MRSFFENTDSGVLITIPGIEAGWKDYGAAWGVGIDKAIIEQLFKSAEIPEADWEIKVIAAYSTGYRGFNGIVANAPQLKIDIAKAQRAIFFDCLYYHDDHVENDKDPTYKKRYTQRAIDTLIKANGQISIVVYRVTRPGTPPGAGTCTS